MDEGTREPARDDRPRRDAIATAARVLGWTVAALAVLVAAIVLWANAAPDTRFGAALFAATALVPLAAAWVTLLVVAVRGGRFAWGLLAGPLVVGAAFALVQLGVPQSIAFASARPTLEAAVASGECPARAGIVPISGCRTDDGVHSFAVPDVGFLNSAGYAFVEPGASPPPPPEPGADGMVTLEPLGGGWYVFRFVW